MAPEFVDLTFFHGSVQPSTKTKKINLNGNGNFAEGGCPPLAPDGGGFAGMTH